MSEPKLTIELVPETCWFSNVRDHVSKPIWDRLRRTTYRAAKYRCEICGGVGDVWPVEAHEVWYYNDATLTQTLVRLIALCPSCHRVKHIGLAEMNGQGEEARRHLAKVNEWNEWQVEDYLNRMIRLYELRSKKRWSLDLSWLRESFGIEVETKR